MRTFIFFILFVSFSIRAECQFVTRYPEIPRIDVHTHIHENIQGVSNYLVLRDKMLNDHRIDLAMVINLGGEEAFDKITEAGGKRVLTCISDYSPQTGLKHKSEDIPGYLERGFVGYKIWHGPYYRKLKEGEEGIRYFDDPAHEPVLSAMERTGLPGASVHIADPNGPYGNRGQWCADPVEYWRSIIALKRVLERHPDLVMVVAHGAWLVCQDAQIDFLRYLLDTHPNLYVDLSATFQYFHLVNLENLKDFIVNHADRILYGTDIGAISSTDQVSGYIDRYNRTFRILETSELVEGGFFGMNPTYGLGLPAEVLEKIYYRNAMKIYPGLSKRMNELGYK